MYEAALFLFRSHLYGRTRLYLHIYFRTDMNLWAALRHVLLVTGPPPSLVCVARSSLLCLLNSQICLHTDVRIINH